MEDSRKDVLLAFVDRSARDPVIGKSHMALFMAIYSIWAAQGYGEHVNVFSRQVMPLAKISSSATYVKAMRELERGRYIIYDRSVYKARASKILLSVTHHP